MAKLDDEHRGASTSVVYNDFRGGLNTSATAELIAMNELVKAVNVEIESVSGTLKTVAGTDTIYRLGDTGPRFRDVMYDRIGNKLLVVDAARNVYQLGKTEDNVTLTVIGRLDGEETVEYAAWEDGIVITSGGRLQYFHDGVLETIADEGSPEACHAPFIKDGRIYLAVGDEGHCSAVGDERNWVSDSNDASSAQWFQVGYKDGGRINGITSLAGDIVIFKDNKRAYRLAGAYPDWQLVEIGRQIDCKGFNSCVAMADQVLVLGKDALQSIRTTDQYGEMKAQAVSSKVQTLISKLPGAVKLRYMQSTNQIWMLDGTKLFLFLDMNNGGFFTRQYVDDVVDAVEVNGTIYILKKNSIGVLNPKHMWDDGELMRWRFQGKTVTTTNQFLVKRERVDTTPLFDTPIDALFYIDRVGIYGAIPKWANFVWHDYRLLYHCNRELHKPPENIIFSNSEEIFDNAECVFGSETPVRCSSMHRSQIRQIDRNRSIKMSAHGAGGSMLINSISYDVAEV